MKSTAQSDDAGQRLTIQEMARRSGLSEPTLRYYEKIGLIAAAERDASSGHRRYSPGMTQTIEALACLRGAGMSIADMRQYLRNQEQGQSAAADQRRLFERHAERVAAEISELMQWQEYLRAKVALWSARECGDAEQEQAATTELLRLVPKLGKSWGSNEQ